MRESILKSAHRIVVKVGSALVTNEGRGLDRQAIADWARQVYAMQELGKEVLFVSSGAIAEGVLRLGWTKRPSALEQLQAAAAVGQMGLARAYEESFSAYGVKTAQVLLTHADLADRERYLNARSTLTELLSLSVVPIINENDTVITDEIKVGDNDTLAALVANLVHADALVILTDQEGLFSADPRKDPQAHLIEFARAGAAELEHMAGGAASSLSKGGMITKVLAAKRAAHSGASTLIVSGRQKDVLVRLSQGETIGTELASEQAPMHAREKWLIDHLRSDGAVRIDAGAQEALYEKNTSLLPVGVKEVIGEFLRGDVISIVNGEGTEVARGISNYASSDVRNIAGLRTEAIATILGPVVHSEVVHKDNLVLMLRN